MDLWQWVGFDSEGSLCSWLTKAELDTVSTGLEKHYRVGFPCLAGSLVFPLVFGVPEKDLPAMEEPFECDHPLAFRLSLVKDGFGLEPIQPGNTPSLCAVSVLSEWFLGLSETMEMLGFQLEAFTSLKEGGAFGLTLNWPAQSTLGEIFRACVLLRAAMELASYERGFRLKNFVLDLNSRLVEVDSSFASGLRRSTHV